MSKYSDAQKYLDDFDNEEREGFKVEVKRPNAKNKNAATSSGKKKKQFHSNKFGYNQGQDDEDDMIEEDI